mmetsp:Transcript_7458/g.18310  ORF Transcript_7458/g.18310 Transcript_7458/m.18310 type:complete len:312 (-) Transcript_7458:286-1221(-)
MTKDSIVKFAVALAAILQVARGQQSDLSSIAATTEPPPRDHRSTQRSLKYGTKAYFNFGGGGNVAVPAGFGEGVQLFSKHAKKGSYYYGGYYGDYYGGYFGGAVVPPTPKTCPTGVSALDLYFYAGLPCNAAFGGGGGGGAIFGSDLPTPLPHGIVQSRSYASSAPAAAAKEYAPNLLDAFRDPVDRQTRMQEPVGRQWSVKELRRKSYEDLHRLWYVLYKEKNMLLTEQQLSRRRQLVFPQPDRFRKVQKGMGAIRQVLGERKREAVAAHLERHRENELAKRMTAELETTADDDLVDLDGDAPDDAKTNT